MGCGREKGSRQEEEFGTSSRLGRNGGLGGSVSGRAAEGK